MNKSKINIEMLKSYDNIINIKLFNKIVSFIIDTSDVNSNNCIRNLKAKSIWFERVVNNNIYEEYGLKYLGELLERFEQRIGSDIKDIRAIALALAYSRELVTDNMIIDSQLVDFIDKIKKLSENDMYLKASLYIYDENEYYNFFVDIISQKFNKTEDIVFVLSLFYDIKQGFEVLSSQLNDLLGKSKTISVIDNCGIYNWIINALYLVIKSNRRKGIELFKTLILIPTCLVKEDSKIYQVLVSNGYTKEEISLLNYISIFYSSIPKSVRIGNSIVEEKIAVNFCINILNSKEIFSDYVYDLISTMLSDYRRFDIKCYGFEGIKDAIINSINIKVPKAFIKFYWELDGKLFSFDILDSKWDVVKESMEIETYRDLFDTFLIFNNFDREQIITRIRKYNHLTDTDYLSGFNVYRYGRSSIYSKLVENDVIGLVDTFNRYLVHKENNNETQRNNIDIQHLREYVKNIETRKAFEFIKYFLSINNHTVKDLQTYNFAIGDLYTRYHYSHPISIDIKRDFLSKTEERELLSWLESYILYIKPEIYTDFVFSMLNNDFIATIISKEDLRNLYYTLIEYDSSLKNNIVLREKYLPKEKLKEIEKQELEEKEKEKQLKRQCMENEIADRFNNIKNANFKSIYEYCYFYRWQDEKTSIACKLVREYLETHIEEHQFTESEIRFFNKICNLLIEQNLITSEDIRGYLLRYIKKGELVPCKQ